MSHQKPFILLDDARPEGASAAQFYSDPREIFIARRPEEVSATLYAADKARREQGGTLAGYIGYEAGLALEDRLLPLAMERSGAGGPLVWLGLFDSAETIPAADVQEWLADHASDGPTPAIGPMEPQISLGAYLAGFNRLQDAIRSGDIYQANYTFPMAGSWQGDPLALYAAIRPSANAGYGGVIFDGSHWLLSFSPELFFTLKGDEVKVKPMKGTRPRGRTEGEDAALHQELANSTKDKAENLMIVDLMRNDISRVSAAGSVRVDEPFAIESYPTVHQMVSTVRARLDEGRGAMDLVRAIFPCGSITGAPKIRAMELIHEVERDARGPYCGAIGRIDANGDAAFNVAIRTLRLTPIENGQGSATLGVGGAIVADSEGMSEWRECLVKGGFVRQGSAARFDLIETMGFDPEQGISHLEFHLERMKASAAELGFAFDRHETRNRIQALCFELEAPSKLRLLLSRSGETALDVSPLPPAHQGVAECRLARLPVDSGDWRLRHKTSDRSFYEATHALAKAQGAFEALLVRDDGLLTEGSFTNIFVERDGKLLTPPSGLGLLPGILRRALLEDGRAVEADVTVEDLANTFFIGNALRGLIPARLGPAGTPDA